MDSWCWSPAVALFGRQAKTFGGVGLNYNISRWFGLDEWLPEDGGGRAYTLYIGVMLQVAARLTCLPERGVPFLFVISREIPFVESVCLWL